MGTTPNKRPQNDITISRSNTAKSVDPVTGKSTIAGPGTADAIQAAKQPERSFAQPSPVAKPKTITPKAHASEEAQRAALEANSLLSKVQLPAAPTVEPNVESEPSEDSDV